MHTRMNKLNGPFADIRSATELYNIPPAKEVSI